jgi:hypothetical protein
MFSSEMVPWPRRVLKERWSLSLRFSNMAGSSLSVVAGLPALGIVWIDYEQTAGPPTSPLAMRPRGPFDYAQGLDDNFHINR